MVNSPNQSPLFNAPARLQIEGAEIFYYEHFLHPETATTLFHDLWSKCAWARHEAPFGQRVPRDEAYYGDPETVYTYSRREYKPLSWLPELLPLKLQVEQATPAWAYANLDPRQTGYNAVLCNLYRDGRDSVGLHADDEPSMGPVIASVSLGAPRLFRVKRNGGGWVFQERLANGSLLIMAGDTQKHFKHEVQKEPGVNKPRINLTFRRILSAFPEGPDVD